jgi:hypothetical protein
VASAAKDRKKEGEARAAEICRDFESLRGNRSTWESHWDEIALRVLPSYSGLFLSGGARTPGEKRTREIYDATAAVALNRFAAIMESLLTPRNQTWHRLMVNDAALAKDRDVKLYFEEVNRVLFKYRYAPEANFTSQNQQNWKSLGAFGTGSVFIDRLRGNVGLRYRNIHLGEIYFDENHQGLVDKAVRRFPLTARQALQRWPDSLPATIKEKAEKEPNAEFFFLHCVKPRAEVEYGRADYRGMAFASYYVSETGKAFLEEGGFTSFPYAISRYEQSPGEIYGRSPAMDVLPAIKTLNEEKKTVLKQGHRTVDPIYLAHDDGIVDAFNAKPGSVVAGGVSKDGRPLVHTLPTGNLAIGKELMDDERALINDAFLITIFQVLTENPQQTATEVMERAREKGILLAPTIGRQQSEYLGPMIERELDVLTEQKLLPPMPQALVEAHGDYRVEYDSPLSRTQRAEEVAGLMRSIEMTLQVVNVTQNPEPLDFYDWDVIIPEVNEIQAVPMRWMKSMQAVQQMRAGRQQQTETETAIQAAPGAAAMVNALGKNQKVVAK